jgi:hypothetical protein
MVHYSILVHQPAEYRGTLYLAEALEFPERFEFSGSLSIGEAPTLPYPALPIQFDTSGPHLDYLPILNLRADLCSQRFINLLSALDVSSIVYAARISDSLTSQRAPEPFWVWRLRRVDGAIDWERSKRVTHPVFGRQTLSEIMLSESVIEAAPPLFWAPHYSEWIIRNDIGRRLVQEHLTGFEFYPLTIPLDQRLQPGKFIAGFPFPPE